LSETIEVNDVQDYITELDY